MTKDYYGLLEVSPRASKEVIDAAFKALSLVYVNKTRERTALNEAREFLLDDEKRKQYDADRAKKSRKVIGNYKLTSEIAYGGFGTTYKGEHLLLGTPVCIKHAHQVSPQDEQLMLEEAKAIWDLRHWAIPAMREIVKLEDGSLAIVMSYVPGPTLWEYVEKHGGIDAEHVCWIADRLLNVLNYLHHHTVVHGDVKPQNIILQPDTHQVVLVDYGLSLVRPKKDTINKGYTPVFASPEQKLAKPILPESDLYSLGVSMIFALGGDATTLQVPNSTPDPLCKFIKRLIAYNPLNRPNWASENLCQTMTKVREESFGRSYSNMKPLKF